MKMAQKLCLIYTAILLTTVLVINGVDQHFYANDIRETTTTLFQQTCETFNTVMNNLINSSNALTKTPLYSEEMQSELETGGMLSSESVNRLYFATEVFNPKERLDYVISLYDKYGRLVYSSATVSASYISKKYYQQWYDSAVSSNGAFCIVGFPQNESDYVCTVVRTVKKLTTFETVGLMAVSMPASIMNSACTYLRDVEGARALLLDTQGQVLYDSGGDGDVPATLLEHVVSGSKTTFETDNHIGYIVRSSGQYSVLVYTPLSVLLANQRKTSMIMSVIMLIVCALTIVLTILVARSMTKPLRKITALMEQVQQGDTSVHFNAQRYDEIGVLGRTFNQMLEKINDMTEQIVAVNVSKKQTEIDVLQSQINPHFMYNTLETFRMMAVKKDEYELAELIAMFGKMLRYNITTINETTTIRREIEYLQHYITIQNMRCKFKIELDCKVEKPLMDHPIIKLLIQPIVENAVFHGLEMTRGRQGKILLSVRRMHNCITIDVSDNGLGMTGERLEKLRRILSLSYADAKQTSQIGLRNVSERMRLFYGESYGLTIESTENKGTLVRITLPYQETEKERS